MNYSYTCSYAYINNNDYILMITIITVFVHIILSIVVAMSITIIIGRIIVRIANLIAPQC